MMIKNISKEQMLTFRISFTDYTLSLPMPKGRGFLRSLILSFHLHKQASLFSRAWPVRPYCIAPKGTQHYFRLASCTFSHRTRHSSLSPEIFLSLSATLQREVCVTPYCHLFSFYIFGHAERLTATILYYGLYPHS